jgi:hypothetical protein
MLAHTRRLASEIFRQAFGGPRGTDWRILAVFVLINSIVAYNALQHDPRIGYDAEDHLAYIQALSEFRLPTPEDSVEYFVPPLPYVLPAMLVRAGASIFDAARASQWLNWGLSVGTTLLLLSVASELVQSPAMRLGTLALFGCLPVYYKTFAFVRGEPYLLFLATMTIYLVARREQRGTWSISSAVAMGLSLGLLLLARQNGLSIVVAVVGLLAWRWLRAPDLRRRILTWSGVALAISLAIGGWFYWHLHQEYGTPLAFNRDRASSFSLSNQPLGFYLGKGGGSLFTHPFRPTFSGQLFPVLYSEIWGDYWGYFSVYGKDVRTQSYVNGWVIYNHGYSGLAQGWLETNALTMPLYLGRVNQVSIYAFVLGLAGVGYGVLLLLGIVEDSSRPGVSREVVGFLLLVLALTAFGYLYALILYPSLESGDTIKATYVLHAAPCVALLFGLLAARLEKVRLWLFSIVMVLLALVYLHNLPAMITHYPLTGLAGGILPVRKQWVASRYNPTRPEE